ncbi:MAG TPA: class I SAM-dependent methyltransferase [Polyangiaceae bacterium]|nr:class I SAM-dependent methyltransferase [Polyangiaceae bacterium]
MTPVSTGRDHEQAHLDALGRAGDVGALAHYDDPRYYAKTYAARTRDVEYYTRLGLESGGPVLEYGIGNGRIALPLARAGITVVGVDLSRPMLSDLATQLEREEPALRKRIKAVHGDMCQVALRRRFPLVIAPFNVFLHLYTRQEVEQFLARVRQHLAPGGRFVFDVSVPRPDDLNRDPERKYRAPRIRHPSTGQLLRYTESFEYDSLRQLLLVTMEFTPVAGGAPFSVPLTHRQFFPRELETLLHYNGFQQVAYSADFSELPAAEDTDSLVVTCRVVRSRR